LIPVSFLDNIIIVLNRPERIMNIGASARAMKNCGITRLRIVQSFPPRLDAAYRMATHATDILDKAGFFGTLPEAIADTKMSFAVTRRGNLGDTSVLALPELARFIKADRTSGDIAFVFGPERTGLSNGEIGLCPKILTIPSSGECPSLNLSHAVLLVCHALFSENFDRIGAVVEKTRESPSMSDLEDFLLHAQRMLLSIGFLKEQNPGRLQPMFRSLLSRAGITSRELRVLRGILAQVDWAAGKAEKK